MKPFALARGEKLKQLRDDKERGNSQLNSEPTVEVGCDTPNDASFAT
jgi:hypothetical protein